MEATDAIKTATNVTAAIEISIINVLKRLPDLMEAAFFRNVGFGRFIWFYQNSPLITPCSSMSISRAAGCLPRPGMVMMVPVRTTR